MTFREWLEDYTGRTWEQHKSYGLTPTGLHAFYTGYSQYCAINNISETWEEAPAQ